MSKVVIAMIIILSISTVYAELIYKDPKIPSLSSPNIPIAFIGNMSFNETSASNLFWRLDGSNSPPTGNWSMGDKNFSTTGSICFGSDCESSWSAIRNNPFDQSLNTTDNVKFRNITTTTVSKMSALNLGTDLAVADGGTSVSSFNARGVIIGGISTATALQSVANPSPVGTGNYILMHTGNSASNPLWSSVFYPNSAGTKGQIMYTTAANVFGVDSTISWKDGIFLLSDKSPMITLGDSTTGDIGAELFVDVSNLTIQDDNNVKKVEFEFKRNITNLYDNTIIAHGNVTLKDALLLTPYSKLPTCNTRGLIANNDTGLYYCNSTDWDNVKSDKNPYGMYSDLTTQTAAASGTAYPVKFNTTEDSWLITKSSDNANFTFAVAGKYQIEISAIMSVDTANKHVEVWIQKDNVNIPRSNTKMEFTSPNAEYTLSVPFVAEFNTTNKMRIMWASDDAGSTIVYTGATAYSPESPSIIMTITKVSDLI